MLRHFHSGLCQRADRSQRRQVVERRHRREFSLLFQQFLRVAITTLKAGIGIERIRQLQNQALVDFHARALREFLYPRQRGALSINIFGPRINTILRWPSWYRCSSASRAPVSLSTITELMLSPGSSQPIVTEGIFLLLKSARS